MPFHLDQGYVCSNETYRRLQSNGLHNLWAFWLDEHNDAIVKIYEDEKNGKVRLLQDFEQFSKNIFEMINHPFGLIEDMGELIKLAKNYIVSGHFLKARKTCDHILKSYEPSFCAFAFYYKALAIQRPMQSNGYNTFLEEQRLRYLGHIVTFRAKKLCVPLLKNAIAAFEMDIAKIQNRSTIIAHINMDSNHGLGSSMDYFSLSNSNEITILTVHVNAAKAAITKPYAGILLYDS
jgi:hypothetical protein